LRSLFKKKPKASAPQLGQTAKDQSAVAAVPTRPLIRLEGDDPKIKIIILGDMCVGKTVFFWCLTDGITELQTIQTAGVGVRVMPLVVRERSVRIQIYDAPGKERDRTIVQTYYRLMQGCVIMYDVEWRSTFESIPSWLAGLDQVVSPRPPVLLVGWRKERENESFAPVVQRKEGEELAAREKLFFVELSANQEVLQAEMVRFIEANLT
jgi:small GTP-binding protein